jgi:chromosome partitioning protein
VDQKYKNIGDVITICNQKGGVGKTTLCFNLARAYSLQGKSVLVVDLDEQANITQSLLASDTTIESSVADFLISAPIHAIETSIQATIFEDVYLLPSGKHMMSQVLAAMSSDGAVGSEFYLKKALEKLSEHIDIVLIDCGPNINRITMNAFTASSKIAIITEAKMFSSIGITKILGAIDVVRQYFNSDVAIAGIVVNKFKSNVVSANEWIEYMKELTIDNDLSVIEPFIPDREPINKTVTQQKGLDELPSFGVKKLLSIYDEIAKQIVKEKKA